MSRAIWMLGLLVALAGCETNEGGGGDDLDADLLDAGPDGGDPTEWDASDGRVGPGSDMMVEADAAPPPVCFAEGGGLEEASIGDPVPGLDGLRADLDIDGDGLPDLLLRRTLPEGPRLEFATGLTAEVQGGFTASGALDARLMPDPWPHAGLTAPVLIGGAPHWVLAETLAEGARLRVVDATTYEEAEQRDLPGPTRHVTTVRAERPYALVDLADGGCIAVSLQPGGLEQAWGRCRLVPVPDVNGDEQPEFIRVGVAGLEMYDGVLFEPIATEPDLDLEQLTRGPWDVRGLGPELISTGIEDGGALFVRYHDPIELTTRGEPQVIRPAGVYTATWFVQAGDQIRIIAELDRNGQIFLQVIEPGMDLRRLGEFGPYQFLEWDTPGDMDGDGVVDIELRGGSFADGTNTDIQYMRVRDASVFREIAGERSARFDPIWATGDPPSLADLDGCEGVDQVLLRSGVRRDDGLQATRVLFLDDDDRVRTRSEPYDGRVHALAIADLDGEGPAELIEIRSENDAAARLRVFTPSR